MLLLHSELSYCADQTEYTVDFRRNPQPAGLTVSQTLSHGRLNVMLHADRPVLLHAIKLTFSYPFDRGTRIFLNGYQSATLSIERGVQDKQKGISALPAFYQNRYEPLGDYAFAAYPEKPGKLHGYTYGYLRDDKRYTLVGSVSEKEGFTRISTEPLSGILTVEKLCEGVAFEGDFTAFDLCIFRGGEDTVFDAYFAAMGIKKPTAKPLFTYLCQNKQSQNTILRDLLSKTNAPVGCDAFLLDTAQSALSGDLLTVDAVRFPNGMGAISKAIKRRGLLPGLILTPFVCRLDSALYDMHPDWFLRDQNDMPILAGHLDGAYYALDFANEAVREHIRKTIQTVTGEWGFSLLRFDFLYAACLQVKEGQTRGGVMCEVMAFLRECAGDACLWANDVPLGAAFGVADYCAVSCRVSKAFEPTFPMLTSAESASCKAVVLNAVYRRQLNGRAFISTADAFAFDAANTRLSAAEKTLLSKMQASCTGMLLTADDLAKYAEGAVSAVAELYKLRDYRVRSVEPMKDKLVVCLENGEDLHALLIPKAGK